MAYIELADYQGASFPGNGKVNLTEEQTELSWLKKELAEARIERDILKKSSSHLFQERWEIYQFIRNHINMFPIEMMCRVLDVCRSGYYMWLKSEPSLRTLDNKKLTDQIRMIYKQSKQIYGSPWITKELNALNIKASRPRVARLMKKANIKSITKKKFVVTTYSKHGFALSPNLLNRKFNPKMQGEVWVSDITYVRTLEGWLYLTVIIDLADRKVIGWSTSKTMKAADTVIPAWNMAILNRPILRQLIFHSDQGVQYACHDFRGDAFDFANLYYKTDDKMVLENLNTDLNLHIGEERDFYKLSTREQHTMDLQQKCGDKIKNIKAALAKYYYPHLLGDC